MIGKDLDLIDRCQLHASGFIVTTFFLTMFVFYSDKEEENDEGEEMEVENSMECKLSLNSYKIRFVKGSEDYLYRRQSLKRAKEVSEGTVHSYYSFASDRLECQTVMLQPRRGNGGRRVMNVNQSESLFLM